MALAALPGFFLGTAINSPAEGAMLFAMIAGFACVVSAVESSKGR